MGNDKKPRRILCLDDEPVPLAALKYVLEPCGYEVVTTCSSAEAMRILRTETVDLLIQDLARPDINGFELCGALKANERLQHIPVVICSGHDGSRRRFQERYPDVSGVLAKPFEVDHLLDIVKTRMATSQETGTQPSVELVLDYESVDIRSESGA